MEKSYKEKYNLTEEEAEIQAYKNQRAKKIIATSAALAVTAAAAYAAYKHYDNNVDKIIKSGATLQNINPGNMDYTRPFYASVNKFDNVKYRGLYSNELKARFPNISKVKETKLKIGNEGIKVASKKSAMNVAQKLADSDPSFKKDLEDTIFSARGIQNQKTANTISRAYNKFKKLEK